MAATDAVTALRAALDEAIAAADGLMEAGPLRAARRRLDDPVRILVIGRMAAGKTTWLNGVTETHAPTGLGGVTEAAREVATPGRVFIDSPGIDDPDLAIVDLQPLADGADRAVWIVDGLQPLTASERDVALAILGAIDLSVVVTKADLIDPDELAAVVGRVRELTATLDPKWVGAVNARTVRPDHPAAAPPPRLGPRRRGFVEDAVTAARTALPPPPPDRAAVEASWADVVRHQRALIEDAIRREAIRDPHAARQALQQAAEPARRALRQALPAWPLPRIPDPDVSDPTPQGPDAARRALVTAAARWLAEGQLVLRDWWSEAEAPRAAEARYERLVATLDAVDKALADSAIVGAPAAAEDPL